MSSRVSRNHSPQVAQRYSSTTLAKAMKKVIRAKARARKGGKDEGKGKALYPDSALGSKGILANLDQNGTCLDERIVHTIHMSKACDKMYCDDPNCIKDSKNFWALNIGMYLGEALATQTSGRRPGYSDMFSIYFYKYIFLISIGNQTRYQTGRLL